MPQRYVEREMEVIGVHCAISSSGLSRQTFMSEQVIPSHRTGNESMVDPFADSIFGASLKPWTWAADFHLTSDTCRSRCR